MSRLELIVSDQLEGLDLGVGREAETAIKARGGCCLGVRCGFARCSRRRALGISATRKARKAQSQGDGVDEPRPAPKYLPGSLAASHGVEVAQAPPCKSAQPM